MKPTRFQMIFCGLLALIMMLSVLPFSAVALSNGSAGDGLVVDWEDLFGPTPSEGLTYSKNSDGTYSVSGMGSCTDTRVVVASLYNGIEVTGVKSGAFQNKTAITEVVLPTTVTTIGSAAFAGCTSLSSISLPEALTTIEARAFDGCVALTSLFIPAKVVSINEYSYINCSGLTSIAVDPDNNVYYAEGNCLIGKASETVVLGCKTSVIPTQARAIGASAFRGLTGLTTLTIPENVSVIGEEAFRNCTGLISITIPASVVTIELSAFASCTALTDVYYGENETLWNAIVIGDENTPLTNATIHYHNHEADEWSYADATNHSGVCACGKTIYEEHTSEKWSPYDAATHSGVCTCGTTIYRAHNWDAGLTHLEKTTYTCLDCGEISVVDLEIPEVPVIVADSRYAPIGGTVKVAVRLYNNPGVAAVRLNLSYDTSILTLIDVQDGGLLTVADLEALTWSCTSDVATDGTLVVLTFRVCDTVAEAATQIEITYEADGITNALLNPVSFEVMGGTLTFVEYLKGDVNMDADIDDNDTLYLRRHLVGWAEYAEICNDAADLDGDGTLTAADVAILKRHLAGVAGYEWD
ncbi:MAG: hypothetical protein E7637_05715 [Ruminococcaceae bacterium]|nr:hypothetical protein [Oscillospiraceae bacterium]